MTEPQGYRSGGTPGGLCGCLAAAAFAVAASIPFLFVWAWSGAHCEPVPECQRNAERMLLLDLLPVLGLALLLGFSVQALVNWHGRTGGRFREAGRPPLWAVGGLVVVGGVAAWFYLNF